jgi:cytochrome c
MTQRCPFSYVSVAILLATLLSACGERSTSNSTATIGDAERGRIALTQYACRACHMIPGVTGSEVFVGPTLEGLASRPIIAGDIPNTPDNLTRWIRDPQAFDAETAMPNMGVNEKDARDMAAYLARLR